MQAMGGPADGKMIVDVSGFNSEARGLAFDPPVDLTGASGLRFGCEYTNTRDAHIVYGFGDQEMCELLGFAAMNVGFESTVPAAYTDGTDGNVQLFSAKCTTLVFPWDFQKAGGPGPK